MLDRLRPLVVVSVIVLSGALVASASEVSDLRAELNDHFEVLALSDGLLLQAYSESGPRAVQVSSSAIALDGEEVGEDELRARLGDDVAELVLAAAELSERERFELLSSTNEAADQEDEDSEADEAVVAEGDDDAEVTEVAPDRPRRPRPPKRDRSRRSHGEQEMVFAGSMTVDDDEVTDDVLVVGGFLKVEGRVDGDATVLGGSATIEGVVMGDVTAVGGPVRLEDGSVVHGHVTSVGSRVYREDGATVHGEIESVPLNANWDFGGWSNWRNMDRPDRSYGFDFNPWHWWTSLGWTVVEILFFAGLAWLALLVAKGPIQRMERRVETEPWKTGLVGLLTQVLFVPMLVMLVVFLAISIIGIPLLLVLPFALFALCLVIGVAFVAVAGTVGSWASERFGWSLNSPFWTVLVGMGLIASFSIIGDLLNFGVAPLRFIAGMFLFFGCVIVWAAWTIGIGAAVLTRFGTADNWSRAEDLVAPLPPVPSYEPEVEEIVLEDDAVDEVADDDADEDTESAEE